MAENTSMMTKPGVITLACGRFTTPGTESAPGAKASRPDSKRVGMPPNPTMASISATARAAPASATEPSDPKNAAAGFCEVREYKANAPSMPSVQARITIPDSSRANRHTKPMLSGAPMVLIMAREHMPATDHARPPLSSWGMANRERQAPATNRTNPTTVATPKNQRTSQSPFRRKRRAAR